MNRASFGKLMKGGSKMKYGKKKAVKKVKKKVKNTKLYSINIASKMIRLDKRRELNQQQLPNS